MADGTMFAGDHPKSGPWNTLKGSMLAPHIAAPLTSVAGGDSRHQSSTGMTHWDASVTVATGMTHGGGTMLK